MQKMFNPKLMNKQYHPFFEQIFYRQVSRKLTLLVAKICPRPTLINFLGFGIGLVGLSLIAFGDYRLQVAGAAIMLVSYILDCVDGELARGLKLENRFGALLDTTLDSIKESLVFVALAWSHYLETHDKYIFLYLAAVIFLQRMLGRTIPWYRLLFKQNIEEIKVDTLKDMPKFLRFLALFFSEAYRSGTIWITIFIGIIANQTKLIFVYFSVVIFMIFIFLLFNAARLERKK